MGVQKGKQGTKGSKQIMQENTDTLVFYRNMILGTAAIYFATGFMFFTAFPAMDLTLMVVAGLVLAGCYHFMSSMATPKRNPDGSLIDEGCDLNIEGGIAEHVKDLVILTCGIVVLGTISSYFWLMWLLAPCRGAQMLWTNILSPWFFQEAPPQPEERVLDKKQRKLERKMKYR
ncbi:Transmembrane protein 208 [Chionoecetes opilio]|uniref:Transmembrane protein 208 n=1 Tax=Chionoecetes opilio TaxID=41210 RepID=A0A8J5CKJ5_CHIOP|nr:Transmembrane protein 208 [Chionoecetes opilio]